MGRKILCVAEKPSIAKAVAGHLGGHYDTRNVPGHQYIKNYEFNFNFGPPWGESEVVMTSVLGHLTSADFPPNYRGWRSCPQGQLFDLPVHIDTDADKKSIAANITKQARYSRALYIWTDCDREGEHIGSEVRRAAQQGNASIQVKRATFSNTERSHIVQAARRPCDLDERKINAVSARIELDLRIGAVFTRFLTLNLQYLHPSLNDKKLSYGSCQFPTLGFVVDRYWKVKKFVPETFWSIKVMQKRDDTEVTFSWRRNRLFDRAAVVILFERCVNSRTAKVSKLQKKPTSKWRPLPLTTVELQKLGSMYLRMNSQKVMETAERLYNNGWISYPRTETDQFAEAIDLHSLIQKQTRDSRWGTYSSDLLASKFRRPRNGRNNDQAHPPIHPVNWVNPTALENEDQRKVYEFITRRFLACCSDDAKGDTTTIELEYGGEETFFTTGLTVLERNYLDVYPYEKWTSSQPLPRFTLNESFEPTEAQITEGRTTAPTYLTEPELISLMDANGIGTDATMAEHINKIKEREYVMVQGAARATAATTSRSSGTVDQFIPTTLGVALIEGYDNLELETSLAKPFLRREMEIKMKEICAGTKSRNDFVQETIDQYRHVFIKSQREVDKIKAAFQKHGLGNA